MKRVLSLCDGLGSWSQPYRDAGYDVVAVDALQGQDVRLLAFSDGWHGILAAPPCTHFAGSGARWWKSKGEAKLLEGLSVVDACLRIIATARPRWWALENPVGRLTTYLGPARLSFQPNEYGDTYTKRTLIWGDFTIPSGGKALDRPATASEGSKMHKMAPSEKRTQLRSVTPKGFADAFFRANP